MSPRGARPGRVAARAALLALACLSAGCSRLGDFAAIARGNRLHAAGEYRDAVAPYVLAARGPFREVATLDLANAYARLGELAAASELYAEARRSSDPGIVADAWYNEGIALHEKGNFEEAYAAFRKALVLDPSRIEARRNLEIAWRDWRKKSLSPPELAAPSSRGGSGGLDEELRLLRRFETGAWRPGATSPAPPSARDY